MIIIKFFTCFSNLGQSNVGHVSVNNYITTCKSYVNVKHLYFHVDKPFTLALILMSYIYIYITLTQGLCKYLSNTFTWPCVNVLEHVGVYIRVICKVILVDIRWKFKHRHPLKIVHNIHPHPTPTPLSHNVLQPSCLL
jgi:hypothetical protein